MYTDSPYRVEFAYAVVMDTFRRVGIPDETDAD